MSDSMVETAQAKGTLVVELRGPDGELKVRKVIQNLITQVGDQVYWERGSGAASPAAPTGMHLGTGNTAPAKTGAGAAIVTYLADSNQALAGTPGSSLNGAARRVTYTATWAAGKATTASPITEVALVNATIATNATTTAANTISRALVTGIAAKNAGDSLTITWTHDLSSS